MCCHLSALTVINALTGRKKNTFTTYNLLLSFWTWTAHSTLLFLMGSSIPWGHLFLRYLQTLFFPNLLVIHSYIWLTCQTLVFCFPSSLLVLLPSSFSLHSFLVSSFLCFYIFSPLLCAMHLFNPPCLHPGYLLLYPVPSVCLLRRTELWWWDVPYTTSQLLRCLSGSLQVPLGKLRK